MRTLVRVEPRHINLGRPQDPDLCPVALALQERFDDGDAEMGTRIAGANGGRWVVSERVTAWVDTFDRGEWVTPFTFYLDSRKLL